MQALYASDRSAPRLASARPASPPPPEQPALPNLVEAFWVDSAHADEVSANRRTRRSRRSSPDVT